MTVPPRDSPPQGFWDLLRSMTQKITGVDSPGGGGATPIPYPAAGLRGRYASHEGVHFFTQESSLTHRFQARRNRF